VGGGKAVDPLCRAAEGGRLPDVRRSVAWGVAAPLVAIALLSCFFWSRRPAYELRAIGDVRAMISAQAAYQAANRGFHDGPGCLAQPARCIPGYAVDGPTFLDPGLASLQMERRYVRGFHPGPPADPVDIRRSRASATSLQAYAYTAIPLEPDDLARRGFCGDSTGVVCFTSDGSAPIVQDGRCAHGCTPLP